MDLQYAEMTNTILKRTTLIVRDAMSAMAFYRDVLRWDVVYENILTLSGGIIPGDNAGAKVQLYIMEGLDKVVGKIGLLQFLNPALKDPSPPRRSLGIGDIILVADTDDMDGLVKRIESFGSSHIYSPPKSDVFPDPHGKGDIEFSSMSFFDPDGYFYEVYYRYNRPNPDGFLVRRCTCVVRDVERSVDFFTNTLGLSVYQDSTMNIQGMLPAGKPGDTVRFVVCRGDHDYIGMVAGLQFLEDPLEDPGEATWEFGLGKAVFVAGTNEAYAMFDRVKAAGVRVTGEPFTRVVPKSGGAGTTEMTSMGFQDPDGFIWEVNQRSDT